MSFQKMILDKLILDVVVNMVQFYPQVDLLYDASDVVTVVGGFIRDHVLGVIPKDLDVLSTLSAGELETIYSKSDFKRNKFGGLKIIHCGNIMDLFSMEGSFLYEPGMSLQDFIKKFPNVNTQVAIIYSRDEKPELIYSEEWLDWFLENR